MQLISLKGTTLCVTILLAQGCVHLPRSCSRCCKADEILFWKPIVLNPEEPGGHGAAAGRGERRRARTPSSTLIAEGSTQLTCFSCRQYSLKLDLLEATHFKLSEALAQLNGTTTKSFHRFRDSIVKWKDKVRPHLI